MEHPLSFKIKQMHAALGHVKSSDLSSIRVYKGKIDHFQYFEIDYSGGTTEVDLANMVTLLIANVGSLRDHFKNWCSDNGATFEGDNLINSNRACAIIHDLWNTDKHGKLTRPPRSGHHVRLVNLQKSMCLSSGTEAGGSTFFSINIHTGQMFSNSSAGGSTSIVITGKVQDDLGNDLGFFDKIVEEAVEAWEACLRQAGAMT